MSTHRQVTELLDYGHATFVGQVVMKSFERLWRISCVKALGCEPTADLFHATSESHLPTAQREALKKWMPSTRGKAKGKDILHGGRSAIAWYHTDVALGFFEGSFWTWARTRASKATYTVEHNGLVVPYFPQSVIEPIADMVTA